MDTDCWTESGSTRGNFLALFAWFYSRFVTVTCGFTANLQLFSWFYSKFVAVLPVVLQQICDCFPDFTANLLLSFPTRWPRG